MGCSFESNVHGTPTTQSWHVLNVHNEWYRPYITISAQRKYRTHHALQTDYEASCYTQAGHSTMHVRITETESGHIRNNRSRVRVRPQSCLLGRRRKKTRVRGSRKTIVSWRTAYAAWDVHTRVAPARVAQKKKNMKIANEEKRNRTTLAFSHELKKRLGVPLVLTCLKAKNRG